MFSGVATKLNVTYTDW